MSEKKNMNYTSDQRRAIEEQGRIIVSASAGSGKTRVMIERIFRLIESGEAGVKDILAVTFTQKAAIQMRDKLRAVLSEAAAHAEGEKKRRLREELELLPLADISTVHSFCSRLIRTYFYLLPEEEGALSSDYRILTETDVAGFSVRAMDIVLEREYRENNEGFRSLLQVFYRRNDRALREAVLTSYRAVRGFRDWEHMLQEAQRNRFEEINNYLGSHYREKMLLLKERVQALKKEFENDKKSAGKCDDLLGAAEKFIRAGTLFEERKVVHSFKNMWACKDASAAAQDRHRRLIDLNLLVKELYSEARSFGEEEEERSTYNNALPRAAELARLALAYGKEYSRLKTEAGALDYDDLEHTALKLLSFEEVRAQLKERYRYVFMDEYQDVNPLQEDIVSCITDKNVFLVGDAKQAIYGFRGSKTEFFHKKVKQFGGALPLTENFRSAKEILDAVNLTFRYIVDGYEPMTGGRLYENDTLQEAGVFSHEPLKKERAEREERGIYSVLVPPMPQTDDYAESIVSLVLSECGRKYFNSDTQRVETVEYKDIAVLTRRNTGTGERVVRALTDHGIPVSAAAKINVCDLFEGKLLINWLQYLDNPEQDVPLAGAMLSSVGGFTDDDLALIRRAFPAGNFRGAVKKYLKQSDALAGRLKAFFEKAASFRALAGVRPCAEVMNALLAEGLEAEIAAKGDGRNRLAHVRRLVAEAESAGSTHSFLQRLKDLESNVSYKSGGGENAVNVLTMHNSKGLEFPVVILIDLDARFHPLKKDTNVLFSEQALIAPHAIDFDTHTQRETFARKAAAVHYFEGQYEGELNLMYVAMTRARYRLHLVYTDRKSLHKFGETLYLSDFLGEEFRRRYPFVQEEGDREALPREAYVYESAEAREEEQRILSALAISGSYPYPETVALPQKSSATELVRLGQSHVSFAHTGSGAKKEEGTAYHKFLQYAAFGEDAETELARLKEKGLLTEEDCALLDVEQLKKIMRIPALAALKRKRVEREKKFLLSLTAREAYNVPDDETEIVFQGAIDLITCDENGYLILDYKYSRHGEEEIRATYRPQIELYRKAVARIACVDGSTVRARIINIFNGTEIGM